MSEIEVYKFGGVAVGSADAIRVAIGHIRDRVPPPTPAAKAAKLRGPTRIVAVVSAMNGITDLLIGCAHSALEGDRKSCRRAAAEFEGRHSALVKQLVSKRVATGLLKMAGEATAEMLSIAESISVLRELTPRAQDAMVSRGERVLARIFARCIDAEYVDATDVIIVERRAGTLWPNFSKCERAAKKHIIPLLDRGSVVIVPGYLGSGANGEVVTLGRGGSDFSAAILARSLGANAITLWKEVDGLMTADPRSVPSARVLPELHYREAAELAFYGAKVLHPRTMIPLADRGIPLYVRNTFREQHPGTRISADAQPGEYPVKALTAVHGQALISIEGSGMIGVPGVAARTFSALAAAGHSVSMISQASSESSICFVVPGNEADHAVVALEEAFALERKMKFVDRIRAERGVALIAVVGLGMRGRPGIAARTFSALSAERINVHAIAQGSSELNITATIAEEDVTRALLALHAEYQLDKIRPLADTSGRESKVTFLGFGQIGRALARQLSAQEKHLRTDLGIGVKVIAVADRSGIKVEEKGFAPAALEALADRKASGGRLFDRRSPLTLAQLQSMMRDEVWLLPSHRPILVDLTSEETAPLIQEALEQGFHIVLANKKPLAVTQIEFDRLMQTARDRGLSLRYEATAGAGLPVLDTLAKLQESGDRVETILGCFSGTLGFIMTALEDGQNFSDAVREAWKRGYTEPDPRDDLSGTDVARKALILARTLGRSLELSDIKLEPLFGRDVDDADPATFVNNLRKLDDEWRKRVERARANKKVLRYVAKIGKTITVGVEAIDQSSPMGGLRGTDNQIVIYSKRYKTNPLVVTGPGAGAEVTAAGVLNDIVAITMQERRRKKRKP